MLTVQASIRFCFCLVMALSFLACAPSSLVPLTYEPIGPVLATNTESPPISIILFEDQRASNAIGEKKNGTPFLPANLVAEWISHALRDELIRQGAKPLYSSTLSRGKASAPEFLITGIVHELWLREINSTTYTAQIRVSIQVSQHDTIVFAENISASQEFKGLPSPEMASILFANTLQDLLVPTSKKLLTILH